MRASGAETLCVRTSQRLLVAERCCNEFPPSSDNCYLHLSVLAALWPCVAEQKDAKAFAKTRACEHVLHLMRTCCEVDIGANAFWISRLVVRFLTFVQAENAGASEKVDI